MTMDVNISTSPGFGSPRVHRRQRSLLRRDLFSATDSSSTCSSPSSSHYNNNHNRDNSTAQNQNQNTAQHQHQQQQHQHQNTSSRFYSSSISTMLPLFGENNSNVRGRRTRSSSTSGCCKSSSSSSSSRRKMTVRSVCSRLFISAVLIRFALYLAWMHWFVLPDYLTPTMIPQASRLLNLPSPTQFRQSLLNNDFGMNSGFRMYTGYGYGNSNADGQLHKVMEPASERRQRTRPPLQQQQKGLVSSSTTNTTWQLDTSRLYHSTTTLPVSTFASQHPNDIDWTNLCTKAGLNATSTVVVTGLFSGSGQQKSPAVALALAMAKQCHVQRVTGVDMLFPNRRKQRMHYVSGDYRLLQGNIPNLQLVVPMHGVGKPDMDWLRRLEPTHVIHMDAATIMDSMYTTTDHASVMSDASYRLYQLQHSRTALAQLLASQQEQQQAKKTFQLVHVLTDGSLEEQKHSSSPSMIHSILASTHAALFGTTSWTQLQLPEVYGPLVSVPYSNNKKLDKQDESSDNTAAPMLYVDNAVAAIFKALEYKPGVHSIRVEPDLTRTRSWFKENMKMLQAPRDQQQQSQVDFRVVQSLAYKTSQEYPYGTNISSTPKVSAKYMDTYLMNPSRLPCSSSCVSTSTACLPSVWDDVIPYSREATKGCQFVAYFANFSSSLDRLNPPRSQSDELCRVAFVSGQSRVVHDVLLKRQQSVNATLTSVQPSVFLQANGKMKVDGWTLIWTPVGDDETLSDADNALPVIDPSRLFADSVKKAMFIGEPEFEKTSDSMLLRVLLHMDRPEFPEYSIKETRSGTSVSRWVPQPSERARRAVLFAGEPPANEIPRNAAEFVEMAGAKKIIPAKQLTFYTQTAHLVQTNLLRPEFEMRDTVYNSFPYQWIRLSLLIHDFTMEESRQLRCDWFDEYLFWGSNRNLEELSLAYVIGKRRIAGGIGPNLEDTTDTSWSPLLKNTGDGDGDNVEMESDRVVNQIRAEVFIRMMKR